MTSRSEWTGLKRKLFDKALLAIDDKYNPERWSRAGFNRYIEMLVDAGLDVEGWFDHDMCDEVASLWADASALAAEVWACREQVWGLKWSLPYDPAVNAAQASVDNREVLLRFPKED